MAMNIIDLLRAQSPANYIDGGGTVRVDRRFVSLDDLGLQPEDLPGDDRYYTDRAQDTPGLIVVLRRTV